MARKKRYNPEKLEWKGVSHKQRERVRMMRYALHEKSVSCDPADDSDTGAAVVLNQQ